MLVFISCTPLPSAVSPYERLLRAKQKSETTLPPCELVMLLFSFHDPMVSLFPSLKILVQLEFGLIRFRSWPLFFFFFFGGGGVQFIDHSNGLCPDMGGEDGFYHLNCGFPGQKEICTTSCDEPPDVSHARWISMCYLSLALEIGVELIWWIVSKSLVWLLGRQNAVSLYLMIFIYDNGLTLNILISYIFLHCPLTLFWFCGGV